MNTEHVQQGPSLLELLSQAVARYYHDEDSLGAVVEIRWQLNTGWWAARIKRHQFCDNRPTRVCSGTGRTWEAALEDLAEQWLERVSQALPSVTDRLNHIIQEFP